MRQRVSRKVTEVDAVDVEIPRVDQGRQPHPRVVWITEQPDVFAPTVGERDGNSSHVVEDSQDDLVWADVIVTRVCLQPHPFAYWGTSVAALRVVAGGRAHLKRRQRVLVVTASHQGPLISLGGCPARDHRHIPMVAQNVHFCDERGGDRERPVTALGAVPVLFAEDDRATGRPKVAVSSGRPEWTGCRVRRAFFMAST